MKFHHVLRRSLRTLLFACTLVSGALFTFSHARAAIELLYFEPIAESDRIRLEWETATELDNAGFFIRRSESGGSNPATYTRISVIEDGSGQSFEFIPAQGDDLAGALYVYYDEDVTIGTRYYYFLEDLDSGNTSSFSGPYDAVVGQTPTPTSSTPTPSNTPSNTNPPPTSTSVNPTATPSSTSTQAPGGTGPTATASPTPGTGTLSPTPVPATATYTPTPDPSIVPIDLTLTAISSALTETPMGTETATPTATPSPEPTNTAARAASPTPGSAEAGENELPIWRIVLAVVVFLVSGGLFTAGVVYYLRQQPEE